jgi:hypothetical protein
MSDSLAAWLGWRLRDPRHDIELWEFEYSVTRYLLNLKDEELDRRYLAIVKNLEFLVDDIRDVVPLRASFLSTWWWLRKLSHVSIEYRLRARKVPPVRFGKLAAPPIFKPASPNESSSLARYSRTEWNIDLCRRGAVRFSTASSYKNEELRSARSDDELNHHLFTRGDRVKLTLEGDGSEIPIIGDLRYTTHSLIDMYISCWSNEYDDRLFDEFPGPNGNAAESCCIIWNVEEFARRIETSTRSRFPDWGLYHFPISYFDPYENGNNHISPGANKRFDFAYQREYRFIWSPLVTGQIQSSITCEIGSLEDIATVVLRDGSVICGAHLPKAA